MAKLIQVGGAGAGSEFDLKPENTVGRTPGVEILVQDPTISRNHASVVQVAGKWVVTDLGSSNGSEINGQRLTQPMPLSHGDQVRFGTVDFKFDALASADLRRAAQPPDASARVPEPTAPRQVVEPPPA
ncbi:MAG: FHA domain-containing protein, partial [Acidobacteriota bacterium]